MTALPLPKDLSFTAPEGLEQKRSFPRFKALLQDQAAWLRFYRRFLPHFFYAELFLGAFLPVLAVFLACLCGAQSFWWLIGFPALWYGVEAAFLLWFGRALGEGKGADCARQWAVLPLRDVILPFLWLYSLAKA